MEKKVVLLKLTGRILGNGSALSSEPFEKLISQIRELTKQCRLAIVIGGGNILRGDLQGVALGLSPTIGHQAGMLATIINGLMVQDILKQNDIQTCLLSSIVCPQICQTASQDNINKALEQDKVIIFSGGTGAPFFTTDTNMVVRALQIGATEVWKATGVDGIYEADPAKDKNAKLIKKITYADAISQKLGILDATALTLAKKHSIIMRVFNIFQDNSLIKAWQDNNFGSVIKRLNLK
ncbi:uridine monophosphate kinase [Candidatus Dependentiae bacterium]